MKISIEPIKLNKNKALILFAAQGGKGPLLGDNGKEADRQWGGLLARALKNTARFEGKIGQSLLLHTGAAKGPTTILLVGVGAADKVDELSYEQAGSAAYAALSNEVAGEASLIVDTFSPHQCAEQKAVAHAGVGGLLRAYRFDKYRGKKKNDKPRLEALAIMTTRWSEAKALFNHLQKTAQGVTLARDLVSEPANIMDPATMAQAARALEKYGIEVEIFGREAMDKLGMHALLGVAQGSEKPPFLAVMHWRGAPEAKDRKPLALIGKGVTFDTGGISLKPPVGMWDMKFDMAGAAAVIGTMKTLAMRKAKANVVGLIGLVENMPSGRAQRPGDIVKSASGQTIEVLNTDAEGRLVLADVLWYAQKHCKPCAMIDLATLTGAIVVSLGEEYAGLFSNDDALAVSLTKAGEAVDERLWRMPLHKAYDKQLDSPIADVKNIGDAGKAGSITGAMFLQRFVEKGLPWAHLDIAGMAWANKDKPLCPKGASGFGVRLLDALIAEHYEQ